MTVDRLRQYQGSVNSGRWLPGVSYAPWGNR